VFRIETQSSQYHLGIGPFGGRPIAILRGVSQGQLLEQSDSGPRVGTKALFDVAPSAWIGERLSVGAVVTSSVTSVIAETDEATIHTLVSALQRPAEAIVAASAPLRSSVGEATGAERVVLLAESAARRLRMVQEELHAVRAELMGNDGLRERFTDAMAECVIQVRGIGRKLQTGSPST
jgi:hypothetical protein